MFILFDVAKIAICKNNCAGTIFWERFFGAKISENNRNWPKMCSQKPNGFGCAIFFAVSYKLVSHFKIKTYSYLCFMFFVHGCCVFWVVDPESVCNFLKVLIVKECANMFQLTNHVYTQKLLILINKSMAIWELVN